MFGPRPRSYAFSIPKKIRQKALRIAISYLNSENRLVFVDKLESNGKTKGFLKSLTEMGLKRAVVVDESANLMAKRAARNLQDFKYLTVTGLNVYDLLKYDGAIVVRSAISKIKAKCGVPA